jgi:hypothetical protein
MDFEKSFSRPPVRRGDADPAPWNHNRGDADAAVEL